GFSYGGRYDENRNITRPGPQNKQIEDVMYDHYEKCRKVPRGGDPIAIPVFVQWEVALSGKLRTVVPKQSLHVLVPPVDVMTAKHAHFTTKQILVTVKEMLLQKGMNPAITPIGLFAHRYHLPRVFDLAQEEGFGRIATPSLDDLPRDQDPDCAYPWLRDFQGFVLANSISRLARIRDKLYCDKFSQK
ncbi:MAG TPA: hypothetical protein VLG69_02020, partial [Candidatus Andersenbacteria bacterium]|nr:hypothetical protein [Candidatus Andersenbacteria bacterium]